MAPIKIPPLVSVSFRNLVSSHFTLQQYTNTVGQMYHVFLRFTDKCLCFLLTMGMGGWFSCFSKKDAFFSCTFLTLWLCVGTREIKSLLLDKSCCFIVSLIRSKVKSLILKVGCPNFFRIFVFVKMTKWKKLLQTCSLILKATNECSVFTLS